MDHDWLANLVQSVGKEFVSQEGCLGPAERWNLDWDDAGSVCLPLHVSCMIGIVCEYIEVQTRSRLKQAVSGYD
jgi:hypothetical protein